MADNRYKAKTLNRYSGKPSAGQPQAGRFQTFEDLEAYQVAREFRKAMYAVSRSLPDFEKFELASQIRRAAISLTNNISEGHGRYHYPDQIKFLLQARGSLEELIDDLNVCFDEKYLPATEIETIKQQGWRTLNVINGYGRHLRQKKAATQNSSLRDAPPRTPLEEEDDPFADIPL
jgi:four helix bundle protein